MCGRFLFNKSFFDAVFVASYGHVSGLFARHPVEMLTDNDAPYTAKDARIFARQLGLRPCFTPVTSPQSNGLLEAFVYAEE